VDYVPYTVRHVLSTLGLLGFTALGFFLLLKHLDPVPTVSLDTDWFYRKGAAGVLVLSRRVLTPVEGVVGQVYDVVMRRFVMGAAGRLRELDARVIDSAAVGVAHIMETVSRDLSVSVSGHAQHYGLLMAAGVLAAIAIAVFGL
jgi:multicomponent Na+:H+ antiporter subunit D